MLLRPKGRYGRVLSVISHLRLISATPRYENVNLAPGADPALLQKLSAKLRAEFALHAHD